MELENGRLTVVDDSAYVLTLDYTIKMLNIHERYMCGVPVIIEGETGVGKTALVEMLSKLWNQSLLLEWKRHKSRVLDFFRRKLGDVPNDIISDHYQVRPIFTQTGVSLAVDEQMPSLKPLPLPPGMPAGCGVHVLRGRECGCTPAAM